MTPKSEKKVLLPKKKTKQKSKLREHERKWSFLDSFFSLSHPIAALESMRNQNVFLL